jgi:hypothetical protein
MKPNLSYSVDISKVLARVEKLEEKVADLEKRLKPAEIVGFSYSWPKNLRPEIKHLHFEVNGDIYGWTSKPEMRWIEGKMQVTSSETFPPIALHDPNNWWFWSDHKRIEAPPQAVLPALISKEYL